MLFHIWWLTTLLLTALGLVMGGAHVLELPVRAQYDPQFYMRVTSTLYRFFGLVGGPLQVLALLSSIGLVWLARGRAAFASTLVGTLCLALSLLLWFLLVQPVGQHSISIIDQWRICFRFEDGDAFDVEVCDYH